MKEDAIFYVGQKAFIKKGDDILVLGDSNHGYIDYPGGKIQVGENDIIESLKREVLEETGLEISVGEAFVTWIHTLPQHHRLAGKMVFLVGYKCEYVSGEIKLSDEHNNFTWVTKDDYNRVDNGGPFFQALKKYFAD